MPEQVLVQLIGDDQHTPEGLFSFKARLVSALYRELRQRSDDPDALPDRMPGAAVHLLPIFDCIL